MRASFSPRAYQQAILETALAANTLVVLPTGIGKTAIAAMLAHERLQQYPAGKILFLAPTKPLVEQHFATFKEFFDMPVQSFALFTGFVKPDKRMLLWKDSVFIFSTPQGLENDLISRKIGLEDVSLLVIDECHRAVGNYSYVFIASEYHKQAHHERILGLTASPGSREEDIQMVCDNLFIESLEVRSLDDPDVLPYTQEVDVIWEEVSLSDDLERLRTILKRISDRKIREAIQLGSISGTPESYSKGTLLKLQNSLIAQTASGQKGFEHLKTISLVAETLKVQHALELCETQTLFALGKYLQSLIDQSLTTKTKAVKNLVSDEDFKMARTLCRILLEKGVEHPKIKRLQEVVLKARTSDQGKMIIFTQFRDTASLIQKTISDSKLFVGQTKKGSTGLTQKEQKEIIESFRRGEFTVLVATSVAEEGLDIPSVDKVIFYEPIPSAIRTVQRRGRTGRSEEGQVVVLLAKNTRDQQYRWSAYHKEKRMYSSLKSMKSTRLLAPKPPSPLQELSEYTIIADYREKGSAVIKALLERGIRIDLQQLSVGDFVVGGEVIVEVKKVPDFVDSILDGRMLSQLRELRSTHKPIIIIEGKEDLFAQRQMNPASIRGMLSSILLDFHIPLLRTDNALDTAMMLITMARRSDQGQSDFHAHAKKPLSLREQQEYVVSALPGIELKLARNLLGQFGSVRAIASASVEQLKATPLIGEKKALEMRKVFDERY